MRTVLVLGATSGIVHEACRLWATRGDRLLLVGRDATGLEVVAADLRVRGASGCEVMATDLADRENLERAFAWALDVATRLDTVLVGFGVMPVGDAELGDVGKLAETLHVTGDMNVLASHLAVTLMLEQGSGSLVVLGSVAGDRGRKSNYVYGCAKAMVETAVDGLRHRAYGCGVSVTLVKPGPTATRMTRHLKSGGARLASAEAVAGDLVRAADRGQPVCYTPRRWAYIMRIINMLPRRVFERLPL